MKKRIISLLMVALMLVSLVPMSVMAANNTTITKQPSNVSAAIGETVTFEIAATNTNSTNLEYLWFDADKVNADDIDLSNIKNTIDEIKAAKLGEGQKLTLVAEHDMKIRCAVYYTKVLIPRDLTLSNTVTLTVTGGTVDPDPDPTPSPSPSVEPTPTPTPTPSPSPSVDPDTCTHTNLKYVAEKAGTCVAKGQKEHWECTNCGQLFSDAAGTQKTTINRLDNGMEKDETNHTGLEHFPSKAATCTEKGNIEYWYCSGCKEYYSDAAGTVKTTLAKVSTSKNDHDYYWVADEVAGVHYQKCRVCGTTTGTSSHSGGTASCKAQAKCAKCGASYGELDPNTHVNFEIRNEVKATETTQGYTGDKYCKDCGAFIEKGSYYSAQCAGGCKDIELVKGTPKTCTEDGTIDYYRCKKCGNMYKDERASILITKDDLVDKCTGTACARAVHAHVGNLDVSLIVGAEEDHLGVLAAQLDGAARLRIEPADRERVGDHLLNVRGAQRGRDIARTRAGHRNAQRLMGKALGELAEHGAHARCLTRPVAAISPPRLGHILVHRVNFGRRRPYVQSY